MNAWLMIGLAGQLLFGMRFVVQWICSERKGESYIPIIFWYFSLCGGMVLLAYAIYRKDPVFIIGQSMGLIVYTRNLILIYRKKRLEDRHAQSLRVDEENRFDDETIPETMAS